MASSLRPVAKSPVISGRRLLTSKTFRLALLYLCLMSASVLALLAYIYWSTTQAVSRQIDTTIEAEIQGLAEQLNQRGMVGLIEAINRRSAAASASRGLYLLVDRASKPLAGNLSRWPDGEVSADGWMTFLVEMRDGEGGGVNIGRARVFQLRNGLHLLVGHDIRERTYVEGLIRETLSWGLGIIIGLSLLGAILMSRLILARVDTINHTSREIMAGDMSRRIPLRGSDDEFDQLATNLNAMLDQIERLIEGIKQVSDNIAHDLRSPLARLRSRLEITLMEGGGEDQMRDALNQTIGEADQLLQTFNALLSIAEAEAGAPRERFMEVDLSALVADVEEFYAPVAEEQGLSFRVLGGDASSSPILLLGDRNLLFQAMANLIENAIKFSDGSGEITLALARKDQSVSLSVGDRGPGIPEEARGQVLNRFFRLESSRSTAGSGLGLSLVSAVAQLHGGKLWLGDHEPGLLATIVLPFTLKG